MEERWGTAYYVNWREEHAVADRGAVVEDRAMREAGSFGGGGSAGRELYVDDVGRGEGDIGVEDAATRGEVVVGYGSG